MHVSSPGREPNNSPPSPIASQQALLLGSLCLRRSQPCRPTTSSPPCARQWQALHFITAVHAHALASLKRMGAQVVVVRFTAQAPPVPFGLATVHWLCCCPLGRVLHIRLLVECGFCFDFSLVLAWSGSCVACVAFAFDALCACLSSFSMPAALPPSSPSFLFAGPALPCHEAGHRPCVTCLQLPLPLAVMGAAGLG